MGMVPTCDVRSSTPRYSSCTKKNETRFTPLDQEQKNGAVSGDQRMTRICYDVLYLKQTKVTIFQGKKINYNLSCF